MIEQISPTTYEKTLPSDDKVEIGDKDSLDFKPHLKLNRWGGECFIKVGLQTQEKHSPTIIGERVEWEGLKVKAAFYPLPATKEYERGAYELEIILKEKPLTNKIILDIESQGLRFTYQPELTQEELDDGCFRPEHIVGSYAVYHATKRNHIRGRTNYMSGKAFHIYRPRIEDNAGKWVWGELHIDGATLTVTIPQKFLATAEYPVRHAAGLTWGFTGTPGTSHGSTSRLRGSIWTGVAGDVTDISVYGQQSTSTNVQGGIYEDSDTLLKGKTVTGVLPSGSPGWVTMSIDGTDPTTTVQSYWLIAKVLDALLYYDAGSNAYKFKADTWATAWPANLTGFSSSSNRDYGVYATYTAPSAGWANKFIGVANASIKKINGVAIANVKQVNGVA